MTYVDVRLKRNYDYLQNDGTYVEHGTREIIINFKLRDVNSGWLCREDTILAPDSDILKLHLVTV